MPVSQDTGIFLMRYIQGEDRTQGTLFPVSLDELIPEDHLVRVIEAYISLLDLEQLGFDKAVPKATGRPSYHPGDLLKLYLYGYFQQVLRLWCLAWAGLEMVAGCRYWWGSNSHIEIKHVAAIYGAIQLQPSLKIR